ncbi:TPA: hypothetical protein JG845_003344 [Vibrio parahaemolyticus]|nr:hypothetical protein [Vibrio parahaemolyticus]HAV1470726.1 hypothetical protein [Vibrio parahaemolyticus]
MRLSNKLTYKLSDVDGIAPIADKLRKCIELEIPVFVPVPGGFPVWAIDPQLESLTKSDVILSETNILKKAQLVRHFMGEQDFNAFGQPNVVTSNLCSSTLLSDVELLQLDTNDVKKLADSDRISVRSFAGVFMYDVEKKHHRVCKSVPVPKYVFEVDDSHQANLANIFSKFMTVGSELRFVLCSQNSTKGVKFNHPVEDIKTQEIFASECEILEQDVSKYLFNETEYQSSVYHLEPEYHVATTFVELSKAGFLLHVKSMPIVSGGVAGFIGRKCPSIKGKGAREASAFLIAPEPRGRVQIKGCQFPCLKSVFNTHWGNQQRLKRDAIKKKKEQVIGAFEELGFSEYYAKEAEKIIRPDQYKIS